MCQTHWILYLNWEQLRPALTKVRAFFCREKAVNNKESAEKTAVAFVYLSVKRFGAITPL
jgi:hypothetical protein